MAFCYRIPYVDRYGAHEASKWGETPAEALAKVKAAHAGYGVGVRDYDPPELVQPQPFSDEARALRAARV